MINQIRREVASADAQATARRQDLAIARARLQTAESAFRQDLTRIKANLGLPIELLNSVNRLTRARQDLIRVVSEGNQAQFRLFVALGQNPQAAKNHKGGD
jgi:outer membrane protein TolC